jgi:hypothetical protein
MDRLGSGGHAPTEELGKLDAAAARLEERLALLGRRPRAEAD